MRFGSAICAVVAAALLVVPAQVVAQDGGEQDSLPEFQLRIERELTYRFLVEDVDLVHAKRHISAIRTGNPIPEESKSFATFLHAVEGEDLREGSGTALVYRQGESGAGPKYTSIHPYWYRTLTIHLSELAVGEPVMLDFSDGEVPEAIVFWTFSGHYRESCYAYPTSGTIKLNRLPDKMEVEQDTNIVTEHSFSSVIVDLDIRFDNIVSRGMYRNDEEPDCPAFAMKERVIFYDTPLDDLSWQKEPDMPTAAAGLPEDIIIVLVGLAVAAAIAFIYIRIRYRRRV